MTDLDPDAWALPPGLRARLATQADDPGPALADDERRRARAFAHPARRRQFALGRLAARTLAADVLGGAPQSVALGVADDGAPTLPGAHVSIAHTGRGADVAALAAVARVPVGVDIERIAPRRDTLWRRLLGPDEHGLLDALGGPTDEAQTLLWVLKESVLKAQRTGFRASARSVRLALDADGEVPARGRGAAASGAGGWRLAFGREGDLWLAVAWAAPDADGAA